MQESPANQSRGLDAELGLNSNDLPLLANDLLLLARSDGELGPEADRFAT